VSDDMPKILVNIDVPELDAAVEFYGRAFGFTVGRRFGRAAVELCLLQFVGRGYDEIAS